jgi:multidrug transporter EmrE-like cation transporter
MISLVLTILFSTLIIVLFRLLGVLKVSELQTITFNYFFAVLYGLIIWSEPILPRSYIQKPWFEFSLLIGVFFIITFFLLSKSTRVAGVSITAVASRMSVLIPVVAGFVIFNDRLNALKVAGIILAIFSFYLIFKPREKVVVRLKRIVLPALLFFGIGTNDAMMKYIQHNYLTNDLSLFLTILFFVAFIIGLIVMLITLINGKEAFSVKNVFWGFILGSFNFGSTYFFIQSMSVFESSVFFPVVNVSIVVLSSLIGLFIFKEKLRWINWLGIMVALTAIVIITIF